MGVKVFCNCCQKFIKDCKPAEISNLKGNEICSSCETRVIAALKQIEDASKRAVAQLQGVAGKAIAELDEMKRRVIQGGGDGANT